MIARTAFTVKKPATTIITTATGRFEPSTLMEEIHPLSTTDKQTRLFLHTLETGEHRFTQESRETVYIYQLKGLEQ